MGSWFEPFFTNACNYNIWPNDSFFLHKKFLFPTFFFMKKEHSKIANNDREWMFSSFFFYKNSDDPKHWAGKTLLCAHCVLHSCSLGPFSHQLSSFRALFVSKLKGKSANEPLYLVFQLLGIALIWKYHLFSSVKLHELFSVEMGIEVFTFPLWVFFVCLLFHFNVIVFNSS